MQKKYFVLSCILLQSLLTSAMDKPSKESNLRKSTDDITRQESQELKKSAAIAIMYYDSPCGSSQSSRMNSYDTWNHNTLDDRKPWFNDCP